MLLFFILLLAGLPLYIIVKPSSLNAEAASSEKSEIADLPYEIEASSNA